MFIIHLLFGLVLSVHGQESPPPNIIFILADDLGWNDVGFHGSNQIPTPNIDALAYSGLILNNYYVSPICTPSRSALMTGKYPIHTGMQHTVLFGAEPRGLPLSETLLPEYLRKLGYVNRIVGKWHLGSYKKEYTPTYRGFESHLGCWTGHIDYNDHTATERPGWGMDMRRDLDIAYDVHGEYITDLYTKEATRLIDNHNTSKPLFLYLAHNAVHSGNPYNPLAAPDDLVAAFGNITNYNRRRFAGVLSKLDVSVGNVVSALFKKNMLANSVVVFSTDNGGPADGFNLNAASNWPLRGVKNTLWEGGLRGAGLIWSPLLNKRKRVASQMMHITDWLPTLYRIAGGNTTDLKNMDGLDLWDELSNDGTSKRDTVLHNIDDEYGNAALTVGNWKLIKGNTYNGTWDGWHGPSGRIGQYKASLVINSPAGKALNALGLAASESEIKVSRNQSSITCKGAEIIVPCKPRESACLFNLQSDPCERINMASTYPRVLNHLESTLKQFNATALPPGNKPLDPKGDPKYWDYKWTNFGDFTANVNVIS